METLMTSTNIEGPVPIAPGLGPIQVELRLGNGVCTTKGCDEGKNNRQKATRVSVFIHSFISTAAIYSRKIESELESFSRIKCAHPQMVLYKSIYSGPVLRDSYETALSVLQTLVTRGS